MCWKVPARAYLYAAVVTSTLAVAAFVVYEMFGIESRLFVHRSVAHRLWMVSERYRSLLSEVNEGFIDGPTLVHRRDELIAEMHRIYDSGFGVDQAGHELDRLAPLVGEKAA